MSLDICQTSPVFKDVFNKIVCGFFFFFQCGIYYFDYALLNLTIVYFGLKMMKMP